VSVSRRGGPATPDGASEGLVIAVSGLGTVAAAGCGRERIAAAFRDATVALSPVARSEIYHRRRPRSRRAALASGVDLGRWLSPRQARRMSPPSRFAVAAAKMALEDAGLEPDPGGDNPWAVILSTAFGPASYTEGLLRQIFEQGPSAASPFLFTEAVANAPAAQVALACKAVGPNLTVTQREAGPLIALAHGAREVTLGRARCALVLAVDELDPLLHSVLERLRALAAAGKDGEEQARPFDRRRDGFLAAEGATVAVLEPESAVRARGGRVLARLRAQWSGFDPGASVTGWGRDPETLAGVLGRGLDRAGLSPADLDTIVSGASGSRGGDRLEALVLRRAWGEASLPPILVPKAVTGEHGGGLLAGAVLAAAGAPFGATPGFAEPDPDLGVVPHDGSPLPPPKRLLATALSSGGAAAWTVLEPGEG